ncbi:uncharacterized protein LOC111698964 isoform X2 [Eurytemora carolleeae]|uniref:uncharacterized protein LOC111698964 isoform X2 n=1 Tax=Eurytemora carolleeae TaxID=1294199 RepID=UPI000C77CA8A|nr:uncharacterized protein LOC111698964 isoform X2 [Eurytemora carolleeae]|eukprot:XP_023325234.1 uncharacterized protein LOC111698964 isoform X2 [Eurytemora affinis]
MASYLVLLLLLSGDVELNPGPPKRGEPKPDPKKVMEDKVNGHDEKIEALEKLVEEQGKMLLEITEKQVELIQQVEKDKKQHDESLVAVQTDIQNIKNQLSGSLSQLGDQSSGTEDKLRGLQESLEEVEDKLWEMDRSWENNLVFYGVKEDQDKVEPSSMVETKIRELIRTRLGITREVQIIRVKRAYTGTNVRGCKPITVYFQKYEDKQEILRKSKLLTGSNIYITEDFSKRVKDKRSELQKFMKKIKLKQPQSKFSLRYDKLLVDKEIYAFNEISGCVELLKNSTTGQDETEPTPNSPTTPHRRRKKSSGRSKNLERSISTESTLHQLMNGYESSREPSPTKSITEELPPNGKTGSKSRPGSPDDDRSEGSENPELPVNPTPSTLSSAKSIPDIPETITEDE